MPSWSCGFPGCGWEDRHPVKYPVMDHIRDEHLDALVAAAERRAESNEDVEMPTEDSLVRATLERADEEPTEPLPSF